MSAVVTGGTEPQVDARAVSATSPLLWWIAWLLSAVVLVLRAPVLLAHIDELLKATPDVVERVSDPRMRRLALRIGVVLAIMVSLSFLLVLQSLGRALERSVFTPTVELGRVRIGLFFIVATVVTFPASTWTAVTGTVTLRGSVLYHVGAVVLALICPLPFRRSWWGKKNGRVVLLFAVSACFGLLASLV